MVLFINLFQSAFQRGIRVLSLYPTTGKIESKRDSKVAPEDKETGLADNALTSWPKKDSHATSKITGKFHVVTELNWTSHKVQINHTL